MTRRVVALLDRPSRQTAGLVPVVLAAGDTMVICGLAGEAPRPVEQHALGELLSQGHGVIVPGQPEVARLRRDMNVAAGWLGEEWAERARELELYPFGVPEVLFDVPGRGHFWLDAPAAIYGVLDRWLERAAGRALTEDEAAKEPKGPAISVLMRRAMPQRRETQAVTYWTRADEADRQARLDFYVRRESDNSRPITEAELLREFASMRDRFRSQPIRNRIHDYPPISYRRPVPSRSPLLSGYRESRMTG